MFGTPYQKERWLYPLLDGKIRSVISMTEPDVASSDPRNIRTRIERDGDHYVIRGRKWFSSGGASARAKVAIVMGVSNPDADPYRRQSMILVPLQSPGVTIEDTPHCLRISASRWACHYSFRPGAGARREPPGAPKARGLPLLRPAWGQEESTTACGLSERPNAPLP